MPIKNQGHPCDILDAESSLCTVSVVIYQLEYFCKEGISSLYTGLIAIVSILHAQDRVAKKHLGNADSASPARVICVAEHNLSLWGFDLE
jgi:hypothetical protein